MTGSGTEQDPYIISSATDLQNIQDDLDAYYELGGNIDASATSGWNAGAGFAPIGAFSGQLDGKGYAIDQLFINRPTTLAAAFIQQNTGTIKKLGLTNCDITGKNGCPFVADNNSTIDQCYATGDISDDGSHTASGFVNDNSTGTITNSYSRCSVTGDTAVGFVADNDPSGTIDDCYSTGVVTETTNAAGFCYSNGGGSITNCFWDTETSGESSSDGGTGKSTAEMKTHSTFIDAGWDFETIWSIATDVNNGYPALAVTSIGRRYIWVEGADLHYFDQYGTERKLEGVGTDSSYQIFDWI